MDQIIVRQSETVDSTKFYLNAYEDNNQALRIQNAELIGENIRLKKGAKFWRGFGEACLVILTGFVVFK